MNYWHVFQMVFHTREREECSLHNNGIQPILGVICGQTLRQPQKSKGSLRNLSNILIVPLDMQVKHKIML